MDCPVKPGNDTEGVGNGTEGLVLTAFLVILRTDRRIHGYPIKSGMTEQGRE